MWPHGGTSSPPSLWDQMSAWADSLDPMSMFLAAGATLALTLLALAISIRHP